jgi:hypothetical protein
MRTNQVANETTTGVQTAKNPGPYLWLVILMIVTPLWAQPTGLYTVNGGTAVQTDQSYAATLADQSAVYVLNAGQLTLTNCTMTKTGDASNVNNSSQYGYNAGILANTAGVVVLIGGTVTTNASGANGLFASGSGSSVTMTGGTISANGGGAHGVDATYGGMINLTNVNVTTTGGNSSALATDFGGGTVTVSGGTISASSTTAGSHSAGIYSTGTITVSNATVASLADCGGVIDGANTISLINTSLTGSLEGIKTWKTAPMSGTANVSINGGSLTALSGDAFYVTGETGNGATAALHVSGGATITASSANLVHVLSSSTATFTADHETLSGNFLADATSTLIAILQNGTTWTGIAQRTSLTLDAGSAWILTGNSSLTVLSNPGGISGLSVTNITGNGFDVHYDSSLTANHYLGGLVYSLVNGGVLTPGTVSAAGEPHSVIADTWTLDQNYPNPFNPSTTLHFNVPRTADVTLEVFDVLGRRIQTLYSGAMQPGEHAIAWNCPACASGMYFAKLQSGSFQLQRRMLLMK